MSRYPGTSRSLGPVKQCAVYVRGGLRCAWCTVFLATREEATVDHLDVDHKNNDASNLVPACWGCNSARRHEHAFEAYLDARGHRIQDAWERIARQVALPLPRSCGELLARRWHPARMAREDRRARFKIARLHDMKEQARAERRAIKNELATSEVSFP